MDNQTATQKWEDDDLRYDLRRHKAKDLAGFVMSLIRPYLCDHGDARGCRDASRALTKAFYDAGFEVLTDETRRAAGLPPRDEKGWTAHELLALEQRRIELMMQSPRLINPSKD